MDDVATVFESKLQSKIMVLIFWFVAVFPLTFLGYGSDEDAWSVAKAAEKMWQYREYFPSRTTGFPLFELPATPMIRLGGWYLSNLLVLSSGVVLLLALFRLYETRRLSHPILTIVSLAFLPVVVKNSSSTMDYIPTLATLMWAYNALLDRRFVLAASLVGVACGFRPASALFVIPCLVYTYRETGSIRIVTKSLLIAAILGVIAFSPALLKYGIFVPYADINIDRSTKLLMAGYYSLQLFGIVQSVVLVCVMAYLLWKAKRCNAEYLGSSHFHFHIANVLIWIPLFVVMPNEPEYLFPMVPSVILLMDKMASRKVFAAAVLILLSYHVVRIDALGGESGMRYLQLSVKPGYTITDIEDRIFKLSTRKVATDGSFDRPTVLMLGDGWIPVQNDKWVFDESVQLYRQKNGNLFVSGRIADEANLRDLSERGYRLVLWNKRKSEYSVTGFTAWKQYAEVIDDLEGFFGAPISGSPVQ